PSSAQEPSANGHPGKTLPSGAVSETWGGEKEQSVCPGKLHGIAPHLVGSAMRTCMTAANSRRFATRTILRWDGTSPKGRDDTPQPRIPPRRGPGVASVRTGPGHGAWTGAEG